MKKSILNPAALLLILLTAGSCKEQLSSPEALNTNAADVSKSALQSNDLSIASILWDGDANSGTGVFKTLNVEDGSTIAAANNTTYGKIWRFSKPVGSNRCEVHAASGFQADEGDDIYIGWRSQVAMPVNTTTNAFFQWKAYGSNMLQNYPIVIKAVNGDLKLMHAAPGGTTTYIWSTPMSVNSWNRFVIRIKVSRDASIGFIEFWYNGTKQTLSNGLQRYMGRTLDADYCDPKWGVYGASATLVENRVHALKIASTYAEAAP